MIEKDHKQTITVSFTNKTVLRIIMYVIFAFAFVVFLSRISTAIKLILISGFLALALNPVVSWVSNFLPNKSRARATAVAYLAVIAVLTGFIIIFIPPLIRQSIDFVDTIPISIDDIRNQDTPIVRFIERYNLTNQYTQSVSEIKENLNNVTGQAYSIVATIGNGLIAIITVLVMTFMMLVEGPYWKRRFIDFQPKNKVDKHARMLDSMYRMVTGYVNGQLLVALIAAIFAFFALAISSTILQVSINPLALSAIVGFLGLIPMFGNTIAAVIVVIFCLFASFPLSIIMAIFFLVYQQVENATLQPYIQAKYNELTPLTVFIAAIIGVSVAGFLGALVAIPIAGCFKIIVKENYGHRLKPPKEQI